MTAVSLVFPRLQLEPTHSQFQVVVQPKIIKAEQELVATFHQRGNEHELDTQSKTSCPPSPLILVCTNLHGLLVEQTRYSIIDEKMGYASFTGNVVGHNPTLGKLISNETSDRQNEIVNMAS